MIALLGGLAMFVKHTGHEPTSHTVNPPDRAFPEAASELRAEDLAQEPGSESQADSSQLNDGTEVVHGIRVIKDRNCTVKVHYIETSPGVTTTAYSCEPNEVRQGPYDEYSNETLAELAYSDADAAELLGIRKDDTITEYWRSAIRSGLSDPEQVIQDAEAEANEILAYMREVQLTVSGHVTIAE